MLDREFKLDIREESCSVITSNNKITKTLPFFSYCAGHYYANADYYTINRVLEGYVMTYTVAGRGVLEVGGKRFALEAGSMMLLDCMHTSNRYQTDGENWESYFVRFGGQGCPAYFDAIRGGEAAAVVQMQNAEETERQMQRIIDRSMAYSPVASMEICLAITGLLTGMAKSACADTPPGTGAQKLIREADAFIHLNYQHNISVEDMGRFLHLSPYHLIRIFKKYTGYSPHEYLNIVRINRAADLLCESDLRVHEVAEKVGFGSVNSFIRNFKKQKGVPPAKFRERK